MVVITPPLTSAPSRRSRTRALPGLRARCEIRVHFDRGCAEVTGGDHFHRICPCGHRWVERASEGPYVPVG
jgi:hypothetical protein